MPKKIRKTPAKINKQTVKKHIVKKTTLAKQITRKGVQPPPMWLFVAGLVAIVLFLVYLMLSTTNSVQAPTQSACTMEAKICPDGTAVGRTGPNCAFAACPGQ